MPTRQEVLEGLRVLSEEILECLRFLFVMLFSMTKAVQPEEQLQENEIAPISQLINEVRAQKNKITELGNIIQRQFLNPQVRSQVPSPTSPSQSETIGTDLWELAEMEEEAQSLGINPGGVPLTGQSLATSQPMGYVNMMQTPGKPPAARAPKNSPSKIAGIPLANPLPPASGVPAMGSNDGHQVALTQAALDQWGMKRITWGKKHNGKSFKEAYESDPGYTRWVQARAGNLHEDLEDFLNYTITRQRLQAMAQQSLAA